MTRWHVNHAGTQARWRVDLIGTRPGWHAGRHGTRFSELKLLQLHWCVSMIGVVLCSAIKNICRSYPFVNFYPANIHLDEDVLKTSWRRLSSSSSKDVFKTSSRSLDEDDYILINHTSLEDAFKTSWSRPIYLPCPYVFRTFSKRLQGVLQKRLQDVFKASSRRLAKTSSRRLQSIVKTSRKYILKTSWRRFEELNCFC